MRERPREFWQLSLFLLGIALSFPLQVMFAYGYSPIEFDQILAGLAPMNWVVIFACIVHAALIYQASSWVMLSTPLFIGAVTWNNLIVARAGLNFPSSVLALATLGALVTHAPIFRDRALRVILNPKLRWWRTPPRKKAAIRAVVRPVLGGEIHSITYDISLGGTFIELGKATLGSPQAPSKRGLKVGSHCAIRLVIDQMHVLNCGAEIVRHFEGTKDHPGGFAVRFISLDESQRQLLRAYVEKDSTPAPSEAAAA